MSAVEEFAKQVWCEMSPVYPSCLIFQSAAPYFNHNHSQWLGDDGTLFELYLVESFFDQLKAEGFELVISDEVTAYLAEVFDMSRSWPSTIRTENLKDFRFQRYAVNRTTSVKRCIVPASCGTGKTNIGILDVATRFERDEIDHVIVWCPSHLVPNWMGQIERFSTLSAERMDKGAPVKREKAYVDSQARIWVINYEKVRCSDFDMIANALKGKRVMYIFDEVHRLSHRTSATHKKMHKLIKALKVEHVMGLSATPVEKSPEDFYNIFRILEPLLFGTVKAWEMGYTYMNGAKDAFWNYLGFENLQDMRFKASYMTVNIRKSWPEIAKEFPEKEEVCIPLELSDEDSKLYSALQALAKADAQENGIVNLARFADAARRCCSLPETLLMMQDSEENGHGVAEKVRELASAYKGVEDSRNCVKLAATIDLLDNIVNQGDKAIVFSSLTNQGLLPLAKRLEKFNPILYYGGMTKTERDEAEALFKTSPDRNVLLVSDAGREGLNVPQAGYLIHYNTPHVWGWYEQRSDRIHRIDGEKEKVVVYRFLTKGTVEERIEDIVWSRKESASDLGLANESVPQLSRMDDAYLLFGEDEINYG